jgi:hypothetical protein
MLCHRRYSNFDSFYKKLVKRYPFHHIPRLVEKGILNNLLPSYYNDFYEERVRMLKCFINYIYKDADLKASREFTKFLNDPEFDQTYFDKEENYFNYTESAKYSDSLTSKFLGFFITKAQDEPLSQRDETIRKAREDYSSLVEKLKVVKGNFVNSY